MQDRNKSFFLVLISIVFLFCLTNYKLLVGGAIFTHDSVMGFPVYYNYVANIIKGIFPYWNPYMLTGTPFYPDIPGGGLLDPLCLLSAVLIKLFGISPISGLTLFCLSRLFVLVTGAYFLFKRITENRISSLLAAGILLFSVAPVSYRQFTVVAPLYLVPFALNFLLLLLQNIEKSPQKYLFFSCLILVTGVASHIYIPAIYILNIVPFLLIVMLFKIASFKKSLSVFKDKKFLIFSIISLLLLIMMSGPSLGLLNDSKAEGELFPSIRIYAKNNSVFKKMIASEVDAAVLSEKFFDSKGVFSSYGNMVNLIYPGLWKQYFHGFGFGRGDLISEAFQYIGIISLILAIIGLLYSKSRYRYLSLTMLIIIFLNMFSTHGVHAVPFNWIQKIFNAIFPFIKMVEVRESLGANFLLYLCMLVSLGFNVLLDKDFLKNKKQQIIFVCKNIAILKIVFAIIFTIIFVYNYHNYISSYFAALAKLSTVSIIYRVLIISILVVSYIAIYYKYLHNQILGKISFPVTILFFILTFDSLFFSTIADLWSFNAIILFVVLFGKYTDDLVSKRTFYAALFAIIFIDLFLYNFTLNKYTLQDNWISKKMLPALERVSKSKDDFEYFRYPMLWPQKNSASSLAFSDVLPRTKGIIIRGWRTYCFFTTKRYYDLLTHAPLQNQFLLGGAVFPIVRFYPVNKIKWKSKEDVFAYYTVPRSIEFFDEYLLLEEKPPEGAKKAGKFAFTSFRQLEDVLWLNPSNIKRIYSEFLEINMDKIKVIRNNAKQYLEEKDYSIKINHFSDNEYAFSVNNKKDGYLYYNDGWSKYWKAYDNDQEIPIYIANYNSKAVFLKKGKHFLRFIYDPIYYRLGLWSYHLGLVTTFFFIALFSLKSIRNWSKSFYT